MIDLHTHILHNLDDGARSLDAAVEMARIAVADGVTTMAATPHGRSSVSASSRYGVALLRARLAELREALAAAALPLVLVEGTEIYAEAGLAARLGSGALLPYAGSRALLVEFAANITPAAMARMIGDLQEAEWRVVVAHPERIHYVQDDPNLAAPLVARGALLQLTADALVGQQGEGLRRLAELLLTNQLVQLIASDCHGPHVGRMPNLGAARARAAALLGDAAADTLVRDVPVAILAGTPVAPALPTRVSSRAF